MYNIEEFIEDPALVRGLAELVSNPGPSGILNHAKIKVTSRCNLRCRMCSYWKLADQPEIPSERMMKLIEELAEMGVRKVHFSGGEPLLRPDFFDVIQNCAKRKMRVNITTNGTLVDGEKAKRLVKSGVRSVSISIDGPTAKIHDGIRGLKGAFKKTVSALDKLATARETYRARKRMRIRVNVVLQRANWRCFPEIVRLAGELGADEVHPMPVDPKSPGHLLKKSEIKDFNSCVAPEVETLRVRYGLSTDPLLLYPYGQTKGDINHSRSGNYARGFFDSHLCYVPWMHTFIGWDGEVYPCCMTRGKVASLGNINKSGLRDVFFGEEYAKLRQSFVKTRLADCARCDNFLRENNLLLKAIEKLSTAA